MIAVLVIWVLPALACNLPRALEPTEPPVYSPSIEPVSTPARLGAWGGSIPGNLVPTVLPHPAGCLVISGSQPADRFP